MGLMDALDGLLPPLEENQIAKDEEWARDKVEEIIQYGESYSMFIFKNREREMIGQKILSALADAYQKGIDAMLSLKTKD